MPSGVSGQKNRGRGRMHSGSPQSWGWASEQGQKCKVVKEKMVSSPGTPQRDDLDVSNEVALKQFWDINESGLRALGVTAPTQVSCEVIKDSKGARFTFTLPTTNTVMTTNTRHQLATSFKKAFYKHRKVLIIINCSNQEGSPSVSPQRDNLELLSNIGIETISVVYDSPAKTPTPQLPREENEYFKYIPHEIRDCLNSVIAHSELDVNDVHSFITLELIHSFLTIPVEHVVSALKDTEILAKSTTPEGLCALFHSSIMKSSLYTPPSRRTASLTPVPQKIASPVGFSVADIIGTQLAMFIDVTRQCGNIVRWSVEADHAIIEFCSVEALERAKRVIRVCGQLATITESPSSAHILGHTGTTLLHETRSAVAQRTQPMSSGAAPRRAPLGTIKPMNLNIMNNPNQAVKNHVPVNKALPPMPDLTPLSSNVSEASVEDRRMEEVGLPPLFDMMPQAQPPVTSNKLSELMTQAGVIRMQQQNQHLPLSPILAETAAAAAASPPPQVPSQSQAPLCHVASVMPLNVTDRHGTMTTFNTMQTGKDTSLLVWNGDKVGHTVVHKLTLRLSVTGPELIVGGARLELRWKGLRVIVMRLKEMCEKVEGVQTDLDRVAATTCTDEELENMWGNATRIREVGSTRGVSYDPYAKSPQKELNGYGKQAAYEVPVVHNPSVQNLPHHHHHHHMAQHQPQTNHQTAKMPVSNYVPMSGKVPVVQVQAPPPPPQQQQQQQKRLNVNATPFTPGGSSQSPVVSEGKHGVLSPVSVPEISTPKAVTPLQTEEHQTSKFDEPTAFSYKSIDGRTHPVLKEPSYTATECRHLADGDTIYVTEVLAAGNLTWAKIGSSEWSLMGRDAEIYLHLCC
eukprot:TRINITY_DN342_c6_g1_i1.p1 TRINITY_DN342_c6_g1~~TRINITY_DN342_c6_g1_i1.p1  ORF type:complete len:857 (+),score=242.02 TRINITY_DN342_c6_g1_i1:63-2633(+)